jgi:hypothetical protein
MAQDLIRRNALTSERDAIRALSECYRLGDVAVLASDALYEARRIVIAESGDLLGQILTAGRR